MAKKSVGKYDTKNIGVIAVIEKYAKLCGLANAEQTALALGISHETWLRRRREPGKFFLREIRTAVSALKIPPEEIAEYLL